MCVFVCIGRTLRSISFTGDDTNGHEGPPVPIVLDTRDVAIELGGVVLGVAGAIVVAAFLAKCRFV